MVSFAGPVLGNPGRKRFLAQDIWHAPVLVNSWTNFGGGYAPAGYMKDSLGFVHLRGLITGGTTTAATVAFTLPVGYRPLIAEAFFTALNGTAGVAIYVAPNGDVTHDACGAILNLSGASFLIR